jgi:broad specificity phosphatase PhoE
VQPLLAPERAHVTRRRPRCLPRTPRTASARIGGERRELTPCEWCRYGGLTGLNKIETASKYGDEQVKIWRRSFDTPPPEVDLESEYWPGNDDEYLHIPPEEIPRAESLKDCIERTLPYWDSDITPALRRGKTVLIAAHGNSIRGMLKHLDGISDEDILSVEVPTAIPLVYHLDEELRPISSPRADPDGLLSGYFLKQATEANDPSKSFEHYGIEEEAVAE